jgi:hypothetical protein
MTVRASWFAITSLAVGLCISCGRTSSSPTKAGVNITSLVAECQALIRDGESQGKDSWVSTDPLPPTIKSLAPQFVRLRITGSPPATVVDIQTSGGFQHRGYLIVCKSTDPNFIPAAGRDWRVAKLGEGVFEYQE